MSVKLYDFMRQILPVVILGVKFFVVRYKLFQSFTAEIPSIFIVDTVRKFSMSYSA